MGTTKKVDEINIIKTKLAELTEKVGDLSGFIEELRKISREMNSSLVHRQVPIMENGEEVFKVDEHLQGLLQFFCDQNIITYNSCQDNSGKRVWVEYDLESWIYIKTLAYKTKQYELTHFIDEICQIDLLSCDDGCSDENDEYWIPGEDLIWSASVRFPKEFLPEFEALIRELFDSVDLMNKNLKNSIAAE